MDKKYCLKGCPKIKNKHGYTKYAKYMCCYHCSNKSTCDLACLYSYEGCSELVDISELIKSLLNIDKKSFNQCLSKLNFAKVAYPQSEYQGCIKFVADLFGITKNDLINIMKGDTENE